MSKYTLLSVSCLSFLGESAFLLYEPVAQIISLPQGKVIFPGSNAKFRPKPSVSFTVVEVHPSQLLLQQKHTEDASF